MMVLSEMIIDKTIETNGKEYSTYQNVQPMHPSTKEESASEGSVRDSKGCFIVLIQLNPRENKSKNQSASKPL